MDVFKIFSHCLGTALLASSVTFISACSDGDNKARDNQTAKPNTAKSWRLKHAEADPYPDERFVYNIYKSDITVSFDTDAEISGYETYYTADSDLPCFKEGDLVVTTFITNTSAAHWAANNKLKLYQGNDELDISGDTQPTQYDCKKTINISYKNEFIDWGDTVYNWADFGDAWGGTSDTDNDEDLAELPKNNTQRTYNASGQLTQVVFKNENSTPIDSTMLNWEGNLLQSVVSSTYPIEYRYDYSQLNLGVVTVTLYDHSYSEPQKLTELKATYEAAECGQMTLERSKKFVPEPFPVCIAR